MHNVEEKKTYKRKDNCYDNKHGYDITQRQPDYTNHRLHESQNIKEKENLVLTIMHMY